jgi:hypothetical protein
MISHCENEGAREEIQLQSVGRDAEVLLPLTRRQQETLGISENVQTTIVKVGLTRHKKLEIGQSTLVNLNLLVFVESLFYKFAPEISK